jgi:hypothetical protein
MEMFVKDGSLAQAQTRILGQHHLPASLRLNGNPRDLYLSALARIIPCECRLHVRLPIDLGSRGR